MTKYIEREEPYLLFGNQYFDGDVVLFDGREWRVRYDHAGWGWSLWHEEPGKIDSQEFPIRPGEPPRLVRRPVRLADRITWGARVQNYTAMAIYFDRIEINLNEHPGAGYLGDAICPMTLEWDRSVVHDDGTPIDVFESLTYYKLAPASQAVGGCTSSEVDTARWLDTTYGTEVSISKLDLANAYFATDLEVQAFVSARAETETDSAHPDSEAQAKARYDRAISTAILRGISGKEPEATWTRLALSRADAIFMELLQRSSRR